MNRLLWLVLAAAFVAGVARLSLAAANDPAAVIELKKAMERMHSSMPMEFTGNPDVDFGTSNVASPSGRH
jgi:Spy/CpxP family protein refolding chaperone